MKSKRAGETVNRIVKYVCPACGTYAEREEVVAVLPDGGTIADAGPVYDLCLECPLGPSGYASIAGFIKDHLAEDKSADTVRWAISMMHAVKYDFGGEMEAFAGGHYSEEEIRIAMFNLYHLYSFTENVLFYFSPGEFFHIFTDNEQRYCRYVRNEASLDEYIYSQFEYEIDSSGGFSKRKWIEAPSELIMVDPLDIVSRVLIRCGLLLGAPESRRIEVENLAMAQATLLGEGVGTPLFPFNLVLFPERVDQS